MTKPISYVNDNYVKTFHINVLHDVFAATNAADDGGIINLSYVDEMSADKYNSHFIVVVERALEASNGNDRNADAWARLAFEQFWQKQVYNALIIFAQYTSNAVLLDSATNPQMRVLTFNPFRSDNGGLIEISASVIDYAQLFWDKAQNLYGHPFRVSLFAEPTRAKFDSTGTELIGGTDALLTKLMVKRMNATLVLLPPDDGFDIGEFLHGGGATGSLAQVLSGAVHVSFNTRFLRLSQFKGKIQITYTNGRDDICFLVPKAGYASNVYNIFRAFSPTVWFMTLGALLAVPLAFAVLHRVQREPQPLHHVFLSFYSWHLAQPIIRLPEHWATKLLIAVWILYCLLITSSYQGNLTSNLVLRPTLPEINTIRQLDNDPGLEILTFGRYVQLLLSFMNSTDEYKRLPHSIRSVSTGDELERMVNAHDRRYAYANKQHINAYLVRRKGNIVNNRPLYHRMDECPVPFLVAYALRIGSPYLWRVNVLLRQAQENGLIGLWESQAEETLLAGEHHGTGDGPVALTLDHMQSPFYILGLGLVLALVGLLVELGVFRFVVRKKRLRQPGRKPEDIAIVD